MASFGSEAIISALCLVRALKLAAMQKLHLSSHEDG